uniref:Zn(2)-C6 fungal-type domain-containing protein n=1 Tax=Mycena chlorophos TaxID=658473 RepID=A0ABQ0L172_MYCCL|nr:predicted protein [Mycena chlorophos]
MNTPATLFSALPAAYDFDHPVRVSRACSNCRSSKTKCVTASEDQPCMRCCFSRIECVYEPTERQRQRQRRARASPSASASRARRERKPRAARPPPVVPSPPSPTSFDEELFSAGSQSSASSPGLGPKTPHLSTSPLSATSSSASLFETSWPASEAGHILPPEIPHIAIYNLDTQWLEYQQTPSSAATHALHAPQPNALELGFEWPSALPESPCLPPPAGIAQSTRLAGVSYAHALGMLDVDLDGLPFELPPLESNKTFYANMSLPAYF